MIFVKISQNFIKSDLPEEFALSRRFQSTAYGMYAQWKIPSLFPSSKNFPIRKSVLIDIKIFQLFFDFSIPSFKPKHYNANK